MQLKNKVIAVDHKLNKTKSYLRNRTETCDTYLCRALGGYQSMASPHTFHFDTGGCKLWNYKHSVSVTGLQNKDTEPTLTRAADSLWADRVHAL